MSILMIFPGGVIMAINGILVTNITQNDAKYQAQHDEFISKAKLIPGLTLTEVKNQHTIEYLHYHQIDFILFWDKDIYLARKLSNLGYKVFNNPEAIYLCDDKALTANALETASVPTPHYYVLPFAFQQNILNYYDEYKHELYKLGFPLVMKERFGSFGDQVHLITDENHLKVFLQEHGHKELIAQQFLSKHQGTDYRVNVVGDEVVLTVERSNANDFRSNINQGGSATYVEATKKMKQVAIAATKAVNAHFAGVDIMFDDADNPTVLEVNSNMRTVAVNTVSDIDLTTAILQYIVRSI